MSDGDWRRHVADFRDRLVAPLPGRGWRKAGPLVPIGLAALLVVILSLSGGGHQNRANEGREAYQQRIALPGVASAKAACAQAQQPADNKTEAHDNSDLCAQFIAAEAAAKTADFAQPQFVLSFFGLIAILATLVAAIVQASAALKANKTTLLIGQNQTRAYISIEDVRAPIDGPTCFSFAIWNTGATPARGMRWTFMLVKFYDAERETANISRPIGDDTTAAQMAGGAKDHRMSFPADQAHVEWVRGGLASIREGESVEFWIVIQFMDVFGRAFELREVMSFGSGRGEDKELLRIIHVECSERTITAAEYARGPHIPLLPGETED